MKPQLPNTPMAPLTWDQLPLRIGDDFCYQLKWDGVRTLLRLDGSGGVELFSKKVELKNAKYPEIVSLWHKQKMKPALIDGEIVYFDNGRPNFPKVLRGQNPIQQDSALIYIAFDLLHIDGQDIRNKPLFERFRLLEQIYPLDHPRLILSQLHEDGESLWQWVVKNEWEGLVAKRKNSPYGEGKRHKDWYKRKKELRIECEAVGIALKHGYATGLVLRYNDIYLGQVSIGLDRKARVLLQQFMTMQQQSTNPFSWKRETPDIFWIQTPFKVYVSALEFTEGGHLRHPKLIGYGLV